MGFSLHKLFSFRGRWSMLIHSFDIGSTMPQSVEQQVLLTKYTLRHLSK